MRCLSRPRGVAVLALAWAALTLLASPAHAQYFGQNKVQYKTFRYEVMKTDHFDIYFYPQEREAVQEVARMAERWNARLTRFFTHKLSTRQPLVVYASGPDFRQTNTIEGDLGEGTGGVTEPYKRRVIMPLGASLAETDHVLGHELVHAFQYDMTSAGGRAGYQGSSMPGLERLPLWFIEGMAEYVSIGPVDPNTAMWMRDAVQENKLPAIKNLEDTTKYFPYRWGQALWAYIAGRWGDRMVADLLSAAAATGDVDLTLEKLLGVKPADLSNQWQAALKSQYEPLIKATKATTDYAKLLITSKGLGNDLNVSPALSPNGRQMIFLSSRSLFSIDLYLADVETGKVTKKLLATATNPHWSSLQFIASAGDWESEGKQFVLGTVTGDTPSLAILDIERGGVAREIPFQNLGEIFSPAWSRNGRYIAFSASKGGITDLYLYDLKTSTLKQLTNDLYADLQPAWAPDNKRLAFVTDRFSTNVAELKPGNYRIGILDVDTGQITPGPGFNDGKNINPQWSQDGTLYFVSDRNGISNIYRVDPNSGEIGQVTNIYTGVSGITDLSPAMSVATATNAIAFSVFRDQKYEIYATNAAKELAAVEPVSLPGPASVLPPPTKRAGDWPALLQNASVGLPAAGTASSFPVDDYKPKLGLDYVGQPSVGVGVDRYGTYAGGGVSFLWSDMLGNHTLLTALQIQSGITGNFSDVWKDSGGFVGYQDLSHRWNWGVAAQQMPYLSGGFATGIDPTTGTYVEQTLIYRQTDRNASGVLAYPFNRAQRVEFTAGFSNLSFSQDTRTTYYDPYTGQILADQSSSTPLASSLNLANTGAALVYDTAIYGATSPIRGQSYRVEADPTFGTINYTNVLADYRKYVMPVQLYTIAGRVLHYGRYGSGAGDYRLVPLYIGYPEFVRGYDIGSFAASECTSTVGSGCPVFDRLVGSRMLIANLELRFPLLRPFGMRQGVYGPVPVEVAFFADAGMAWGWDPYMSGTFTPAINSSGPVDIGAYRTFNTKDAVSSAGVSFRVNALGFAVLQFDFAKPFQRPGRGWVFSWTLAPGW